MPLPYTVLVAEDDPLVLEVVASALDMAGYTVLTAPNGYEALRILEERRVDLMLTDVRMPELNGFELVSQAKMVQPDLRVVMVTGFADAVSNTTHGTLLQKPFHASDLVRTIHAELTGG
jgi:YesN/AraC family two-component response regulator